MILIAGYGYLGREVGRQLSGHHEFLPVTRSGGEGSVACDLTDVKAVQALAESISPTHILASASSGRGGTEDYRAIFVEGTRNLLKSFPDARLTFISSTSVYRQTNGSLVDESSDTGGSTDKSRILLAAEDLVLESGGTVLRLAGIYGPERSYIVQSLLRGDYRLEDTGDAIGKRQINQIHVVDAAAAFVHLLEEGESGLFNVCDDDRLSQLELVTAICEHLNLPVPEAAPPNPHSKRGWTNKAVSNERLKATGWQPGHPSLISALDEIIPTLTLS